jgi:hypothetical protein
MTTKKRDDNDDTDLKPNEPQAKEGAAPKGGHADTAAGGHANPAEGPPPEDLGIPGNYTEAQKQKMRDSRNEPPNTPDTNPETELETIKRNTEAAVEGRSVDIGSAPKVSEGSSGGKNEVKDGIPTHEMQTQVSNQIDADRRKEQQKAQAEHDAEAKKIRETVAAEQKKQAADQPKEQPKAKAKDDDDDDDDRKGRKR